MLDQSGKCSAIAGVAADRVAAIAVSPTSQCAGVLALDCTLFMLCEPCPYFTWMALSRRRAKRLGEGRSHECPLMA